MHRWFRRGAVAATALALAACKGEADEPPPSRADEERTVVTLQSYVYATTDETSFKVAERIRNQVKSAFGALRSLRVTGSNQQMAAGTEDHLYKEPLVLLSSDGREVVVMRVWYRFTDEVIAPATVPRGVPMLVGGLHRQDEARFTDIVTACTANTAREREYRGRLQSVFDGSLDTCQQAILAEQAVIDAARVSLDDPDTEIVREEFERVYVPVVARLLGRKASQMGKYPRFEPVVPQAGRMVAAASPTPSWTTGTDRAWPGPSRSSCCRPAPSNRTAAAPTATTATTTSPTRTARPTRRPRSPSWWCRPAAARGHRAGASRGARAAADGTGTTWPTRSTGRSGSPCSRCTRS